MKKKDFSRNLKINCLSDEGKERTKVFINLFNIENGEQSTKLYCKSDVILLGEFFAKFTKVSVIEFDNNLRYFVSLPGYTWQRGMHYTDNELETLRDKDLVLTLENNIRCGISCVMGHRCVRSDENKKILYVDANSFYGWAMSKSLPYDIVKFDGNFTSEDILINPDDNDIGCFVEVHLTYP